MRDLDDLAVTIASEGAAGSDPFAIRIHTLSDAALVERRAWLVRGLIPRTGLGVLFGKPGAGKSFIALDLAAHVAAGGRWLGASVCQGRSLIAGLEGRPDFRRRLVALRSARAQLPGDRFFWTDDELRLASASSVDAFLDAVEARWGAAEAAEAAEADGEGDGADPAPRLVIVDTLARAAAGLDENAPKDMTMIVAACERISARLSAFVMLVHHPPHDAQRPRGSSILEAAADVIFKVERGRPGERTLSVTKNKAGEEGGAWRFELEPVAIAQSEAPPKEPGELGEPGEDDEPASSCVVAWRGAAQSDDAPALSPLAQTLLARLRDCGRDAATPLDDLIAFAVERGATGSPDPKNRRDAVRRALRLLEQHGLVAIDGEQAWLCDPATGRDQAGAVAPARATGRDRPF